MAEIKYFGLKDKEFNPSVLLNRATGTCLSVRNQGEFVPDPDLTATWTYWTKSNINERDKWTEGCDSCIASVVLGQGVSGQRLSLLAHIGPGAYYDGSGFRKSYADILSDFAEVTLPQREAFLGGGRKNMKYVDIFDQRHYRNASLLIARLNRSILGVPTKASPPKKHSGKTNVYVQTNENKILIVETGLLNAEAIPAPLSPKIRQIKRFWFLNP